MFNRTMNFENATFIGNGEDSAPKLRKALQTLEVSLNELVQPKEGHTNIIVTVRFEKPETDYEFLLYKSPVTDVHAND